VVWEDMSSVKYYEPWRNVLRHIASPISTYEQAKAEILDGGETSDLFDNLRQLEIIDEIVGEKVATSQEQIDDALRSAKACATRFDEELELAYTYDRIKETEKESLAGIKRQYMATFFDSKDFGTWRQFLKALTVRIEELTKARKAELQRMPQQKKDPVSETQTNRTGPATPRKAKQVIGRNDTCPCGSGLKYKNCCGKHD
jgi:uncharacterized protein YecA (UPF0149 family)